MNLNKRIAFFIGVFFIISCGKKISTTTPITSDVNKFVFATGVLKATDYYELTALEDGYVTELNFEEGLIVTEGQLLCVIESNSNLINIENAIKQDVIAERNYSDNSPALKQAFYAIEAGKNQMEFDSAKFARYTLAFENKGISEDEFEQAKSSFKKSKSNYNSAVESYRNLKSQLEEKKWTALANRKTATLNNSHNDVRSITNGKIYNKYVEVGDFVRKGDAIARIGSADDFYVLLNIDESSVHLVKEGQEANIKLNTDESKVYRGIVNKVYPSFDETSQSFLCKVLFIDPLDFKYTETQLQVNILVESKRSAMLIPKDYLDFEGQVELKNDTTKRRVTVFFIGDQYCEVTEGLSTSDVLIMEAK